MMAVPHNRPKGAPKGRKRATAEVKAELRAQVAVELKTKGLSYEAIAKELGFAGRQGAREAVKRQLQRTRVDGVNLLRKVDNARLEAIVARSEKIVATFLPVATKKGKPSTWAGELVLKALDRIGMAVRDHRALNGLDRPIKVDVSGEVKAPVYDQILDRLTRIAAAAATGESDQEPKPSGG